MSSMILLLLGTFVGISIFSYSLYMDQWFLAVYTEYFRLILGAVLFLWAQEYEILPAVFQQWYWILIFYFLLSVMGLTRLSLFRDQTKT